MDFLKTDNILTKEQLEQHIQRQKDFIETGQGKPAQHHHEFMHLLTGDHSEITVLDYTWVNKTKREIEAEESKAQAEADLLAEYQSNPEKWREDVIKPWSMQKLAEWIDQTYIKPLQYDLSPEQCLEREAKRLELLEYHNQIIYTENPVQPSPPSYL